MRERGVVQRGLGVLLLVEAVAIGIVGALHPFGALPVPRVGAVPLPRVVLPAALAVLLAWAGAVRLVLPHRVVTRVLVDLALTAPVTVFLVAMLNGIDEATALVPLYALSSAAWLLVVLQQRVRVVAGHPLLPLCFAAGVGIVPWGVVALQEVAGMPGLPAGVRVVTLIALAGQIAAALLLWRCARGRAAPVSVVVAGALSVLAWSCAALL